MSRRTRAPLTMQRRRAVAESTATLERLMEGIATEVRRPVAREVVETPAARIVEATPASPGRPAKLLIQLISAGWSLNGRYYSAEVLKRDGPSAFPAGLHNFVDHATEAENAERPSGSLRDMASVLISGARWDATRKALLAEVRVFAPWQEAVMDWAQSGAIGMSIRAYVEGEPGTAEGQEGWIVTSITEGRSVDYVTKAAAGGKILAVLESIGNPTPIGEARNVAQWFEARIHAAFSMIGDEMYGEGRLTRDERIALSSAMGDALAAFSKRVESDAPNLYGRDLYDDPDQQAADEAATPTPPADGTPPADPPAAAPPPEQQPPAEPPTEPPPAEPAPPAGQPDPPGTEPAGTPPSTEEQHMSDPPGTPPTTPGTARQVIEAEVANLRRQMATMQARERAREILSTALSDGWIQPATVARITESCMARLPMTSTGDLDETALTAMAGRELQSAEREAAEVLSAAGMGRVRDLGSGDSFGTARVGIAEAEVNRRLEAAFSQLGNEDKVAKAAAKGRD